MCTIALLLDVVPQARVVIAANRDELYARAALAPAPISRFGVGPRGAAIGGVDAQSGGTWLALTRGGRFAAVTNQRALAPPPASARSRGLVVGELATAPDMRAYVDALDPTHYASMNLVWGDPDAGVHVAYLRHDGAREVARLAPGIHVLCNDRLGAPGFPRGERLAAALARVAPTLAPRDLVPALQPLLADHARVPDAAVPPSELPPAIAHALTACCIHTDHYGTRSATIAALADDRVLAYHHADGAPCTHAFVDDTALVEAA